MKSYIHIVGPVTMRDLRFSYDGDRLIIEPRRGDEKIIDEPSPAPEGDEEKWKPHRSFEVPCTLRGCWAEITRLRALMDEQREEHIKTMESNARLRAEVERLTAERDEERQKRVLVEYEEASALARADAAEKARDEMGKSYAYLNSKWHILRDSKDVVDKRLVEAKASHALSADYLIKQRDAALTKLTTTEIHKKVMREALEKIKADDWDACSWARATARNAINAVISTEKDKE